MSETSIKTLREAKDLSPRELAELSGISHQTIRDAEIGKRSPKLETLEALARGLGCKVGDLVA